MIILTLIILISLLLVGFVVFAIIFGIGKIGNSNLDHLLKIYSTSQTPPPALKKFQTVQIGAVVWKNCVDLGTDNQGLYLKINAPFKSYPALFFPWAELTISGQGKLYWQNTHNISIGQPPIGHLQLIAQDHPEISQYLSK
ncbi:MAG: hypothetical protein ACOZAR_03875 [Patescibacteria group bacterium]